MLRRTSVKTAERLFSPIKCRLDALPLLLLTSHVRLGQLTGRLLLLSLLLLLLRMMLRCSGLCQTAAGLALCCRLTRVVRNFEWVPKPLLNLV